MGVDLTQFLTIALILTLTLTPSPTQNGPEMGQKRGPTAFRSFLFNSDLQTAE